MVNRALRRVLEILHRHNRPVAIADTLTSMNEKNEVEDKDKEKSNGNDDRVGTASRLLPHLLEYYDLDFPLIIKLSKAPRFNLIDQQLPIYIDEILGI